MTPLHSPFKTVVILAVTAVFFSPAQAAKKDTSGDTAPVLVSTKGNAPKWKNLAELKQFAAQGNPKACFELGVRYVEGDEVAQDTPKAILLFEVASKGGVTDALFRLGKIYHDGTGVPIDYARAFTYFIPAAQAGVMEAQHNIGAMLLSARGVKRDVVEGLAWLIVAGKSGDTSGAEAQVRAKLEKKPKDIATAEARAVELLQDLPHATVHGVSPSEPAAENVIAAPKVEITAPIPTPLDKPKIAAPKLDAPEPLIITLPTKPESPAVPGK